MARTRLPPCLCPTTHQDQCPSPPRNPRRAGQCPLRLNRTSPLGYTQISLHPAIDLHHTEGVVDCPAASIPTPSSQPPRTTSPSTPGSKALDRLGPALELPPYWGFGK